MKWMFLWAAMAMVQAGTVEHPELAGIKTVYLLPMTSSLDQFLAARLTKGGAVQVVTDPKLADAVLTDYIGAGLEEKLNSLYGEKKQADVKDKDKDKESSQPSFSASPGAGHSKGTIFLIDRKTRSVIWSDYVPPKSTQPEDLNRAADRIASQLEKEKKGKRDK
ncbi:MAG TPA: hypothetical protein VMT15_21105 [Bryobacteraceae bacterium]|nr:hypothetical protein [Bryobacteraceae bacterium]